MPPTPRCWVEAASTARSIARPAPRCRRNAARCAVAGRARPASPAGTGCPVYRDGVHGEPEKLRSCYEHVLAIAAREKFKSIAFPAISCGAYSYPVREAADIAVTTVLGFLAANALPARVIFCCREDDVFDAYQRRIEEADLA